MPRNHQIAVAFALSTLGLNGCSTTTPFGREKLAIKAETQYVGGRGYAMYPTTPNLVENVKATLAEMGMHSIHSIPEPNGGIGLEAVTADRRAARLSIHTTGVRSTVALKVGWTGDEPLTRSFLERLEGRQGALPSSAVPDDEPEQEAKPGRFAKDAVPDSTMFRNQLDSSFNPSISP